VRERVAAAANTTRRLSASCPIRLGEAKRDARVTYDFAQFVGQITDERSADKAAGQRTRTNIRHPQDRAR